MIMWEMLKKNLILVVAIGSFASGYYIKYKFDQAAEAKSYKEVIAQIQQNDLKSRQQIALYQTEIEDLSTKYNTLQERAKHVKIITSKCDITADGIRLWNDSSKGTMSEDSTGVTETASTTSTITIAELMDNKIKNDEICNGLRLQIESIIKWDKDEFDSSRN